MGEQSYLIRYGVMSHVGRFPFLPVHDTSFERGQLVVLQTDRGVELGEVLIAVDGKSAPEGHGLGDSAARSDVADSSPALASNAPHVLRVAGPDDLLCRERAELSRPSRFSLCQRILQDGNWPWELIDVEPLLDGRSTVIHYLGPHHIDVATLRARFRMEFDIDVVLESVGTDLDSEGSGEHEHLDENTEGCGSCGCSDGGGCGTKPVTQGASQDHGQAEPAASGCATKAHSGCSTCGIGGLLANRKRDQASSAVPGGADAR